MIQPLRSSALLLLAVVPCLGIAATTRIDSVAGLEQQLQNAAPGDTLVVANGTYELPARFAIRSAGAEGKPIVLQAETVGGVKLTGPGGITFSAPAAYVTVQGFVFAGAAGKETVPAGTHHVRFTRNTFVCAGEGPYLTVSGDNVEVDHNEFRDKHTLGNMINVTGSGSQVARRLWVHHNYFHDFANAHGNGAETIRFGLSGLSMSTGAGLVEHNLFVRCTGENELISNKSCGNTYRFNTFLESAGAQLTLRHGNDCQVYGNVFRGTDGLRIFGDRHVVFANHFDGNTRGINLGNGDGEVADGAKLTSHDRPDDCLIAANTLVNNRDQYQMDARKNGLGATRTAFVGNVIIGGDVVAKIGGPNADARWQDNLVWPASAATGDIPAGGVRRDDPRLKPDADGVYRPQPDSPVPAMFARAAAFAQQGTIANWKNVTTASVNEAVRQTHPLRPADVGPTAP